MPRSQISMVMGYFFCLSAAFVLAKYVRDQENYRRYKCNSCLRTYSLGCSFFYTNKQARALL